MSTTGTTALTVSDHHAVVDAAVAAGACAGCARLVLAIVVGVVTAQAAADDEALLTGREQDVLVLLEQGMTAAQIGRRLAISSPPCASTSSTSTPSSACTTGSVPRRTHDATACSGTTPS